MSQTPEIEVPRNRLHGDPSNPSLGCGDYSTVLDKVISPGGLDVPCDEKYIATDYANTIERYDTVALQFVSSTPAVAGGDLVFAGATQLEFFVNGLDKQQSQNQAAPLYSTQTVLAAFGGLMPGDGYPIRKGQGDTNAFVASTSNPGAGQGAKSSMRTLFSRSASGRGRRRVQSRRFMALHTSSGWGRRRGARLRRTAARHRRQRRAGRAAKARVGKIAEPE